MQNQMIESIKAIKSIRIKRMEIFYSITLPFYAAGSSFPCSLLCPVCLALYDF